MTDNTRMQTLTDAQKRAVDKAMKMLTLATNEGATAEEADAAYRRLGATLAKQGLTREHLIGFHDDVEKAQDELLYQVRTRFERKDTYAAISIAAGYVVGLGVAYSAGSDTYKAWAVGTPQQRKAFKLVFELLINQLEAGLSLALKSKPSDVSRFIFSKSYCAGFAEIVVNRARSIAVLRDGDMETTFANMNATLAECYGKELAPVKRKKERPTQLSTDGFYAGLDDGASADIGLTALS